MIGNPTNFVHTGHIGSADVELSSHHLNSLQNQMQSKGGYVDVTALRLSGNYEKIKVSVFWKQTTERWQFGKLIIFLFLQAYWNVLCYVAYRWLTLL